MVRDKPTEILVRGVRLPPEGRDRDPRELVADHLGLPLEQVQSAAVVRRSLDSRKGRPRFVLALRAFVARPEQDLPAGAEPCPPEPALEPPPPVRGRPDVAVVGAGPAGLFAALRLSEAGIAPVILDRGEDLAGRCQAVSRLLQAGTLDPESNFHFGLGGAGTFSDGKLFTRLHQTQVRKVLEVLAAHGAGSADEILVEAHPHVGTDRWPTVLQSLQRGLVSRSCRFRFASRVTGLRLQRGTLVGLNLADGELPCQAAILAPGNSARDLFAALSGCIPLAAKPFAVGVRMIHPQQLIDRIQYGKSAGSRALPPASYRLTASHRGRGVYTFCMCPGGEVIPTPTEADRLCLNGMSNSRRSSGEANSALVAGVSPPDLGNSDDPLAGIAFQRELEEAAYRAGGGGYLAPAMSLRNFLRRERPGRLPECGFRPGVRLADVGRLLPSFLLDALRHGLALFCRQMRQFDHPDAVVLGLETRTSSPVRIVRDASGMSPGAAGLFPAGEGSGYAGGITSSAIDGLRAADALITWWNRQGPTLGTPSRISVSRKPA